ncbi:rhodanese domain-containing protein CG4456 isoform 1-T2 [Aphomia sociella]
MLSRIIRTLPSSLKIMGTLPLRNSEMCFKNPLTCPLSTTNLIVKQQTYCTQVNPEEIIVDYDHVKKATSINNILIVDVREPDEIKEHGKIPNSINIPLGNVTTVLSSMSETEFKKTYNRPKPAEDTEIIFYCMIGKRSGMAQQNAMNLGYKNVKNYLGSWTEWATKGK